MQVCDCHTDAAAAVAAAVAIRFRLTSPETLFGRVLGEHINWASHVDKDKKMEQCSSWAGIRILCAAVKFN